MEEWMFHSSFLGGRTGFSLPPPGNGHKSGGRGGNCFLTGKALDPVPEVRGKGFLRICPVLSLPNSGTERKIAEMGAALFFRGIRLL
jgi:hypothetical protein